MKRNLTLTITRMHRQRITTIAGTLYAHCPICVREVAAANQLTAEIAHGCP